MGGTGLQKCLQRVSEEDGSGTGGESEQLDPAGSGAAGLCPAARLVRGQGWLPGGQSGAETGTAGLAAGLWMSGSRAGRSKSRTDAPHLEASLVPCSCSLSTIPSPFPSAMCCFHP